MQLYRGISESTESNLLENFYLKTPRKPKNSHINVHDVADNWFLDKFGVRARSQAIFCTTDIEQAKEYGQPYKISIPESVKFKLIFSVHVNDFIEIEAEISDVNNDKQILEWLESKSYDEKTCFSKLPNELDGEVMLYCESYEILKV